MKVPTIAILHRGPTPYLYYVVKQARRWNPEAEFVVFSDLPRPELKRYATVIPLERYASGSEELARSYQHHSGNPFEFELFCFQRWFILREYVAAHGVRQLVHLDSDVLAYTSFASEFARLGSFDVGTVGFQGPQSMLIAEPAFLSALCGRITQMFTEEAPALAAMYAQWKAVTDATAVSDMHALHTLLAKGAFQTLDLSVVRDDAAYDGVIHEPEGYDVANGQKLLSWRAGQPWGRRSDSGAHVRFCSLHCQGASKFRILEHFRARDASYYYDRLRARIARQP